MKVLVTSHRGFIGAEMVPLVLAEGHDVVGLGSDWYELCPYPGGATMASVPTLRGDVRDMRLEDMWGFDACIDLAALRNDSFADLNLSITSGIYYGGSRHLAQLATGLTLRDFTEPRDQRTRHIKGLMTSGMLGPDPRRAADPSLSEALHRVAAE